MNKNFNIILLSLLLLLCTNASGRELGVWTIYNAYSDLTHVVPTHQGVYALSDGRLYCYRPSDDSFQEHNVSTTLSNSNFISDICYNSSTQRLVICYTNGNIDLLNVRNGNVRNISAIVNETTTRSKEIKNVFCHGNNAYITMNYGVIIINTAEGIITKTYRIDETAQSIQGTYVTNDSIFLSASGNITGHSSSVVAGALRDNLMDKSKWNDVNSKRSNEVKTLISNDNQKRNIYVNGTTKKNNDKIYDQYNRCYWGSNDNNVLIKYSKDEETGSFAEASTQKKPYGPASNDFYNIRFMHGKLYTVGTSWRRDSPNMAAPGMVQVMDRDGKWQRYEEPTYEQLGHYYRSTSDIIVDPRDTSHVFVAAKCGLFEFKSGKFTTHYDYTNSPILGVNDSQNQNYQIILGAIYDKSGQDLWLLNSFCSNGLLKLSKWPQTEWKVMKHSELDIPNDDDNARFLMNPIIDKNGCIWFINNHWLNQSFYCYNPANDVLRTYLPRKNQDGNTLFEANSWTFIRNIAEDKEGNIWIAGQLGIFYVPAKQRYEATNVMYQHKVNRNDGTGLADYLLSTVDASCIVFDSANRMFVSTLGNGVYVISADRNEELQHYTTENSNIISDNVYYLALDEQTGELYMSTDRGLCSVTTDATPVPASLSSGNVIVYPNPVTPDYTGPITFEGLTVGADIKITTATGYVVHRGRTTSGLYQWDGCDLSGKRVASGVYNVLAATPDGEQGCVAKVAMVR